MTTPSSRARRLILALCAVSALVSSVIPVTAEAQRAEHRIARRVLFPIYGAIVGLAASSSFILSRSAETTTGMCVKTGCVVPVAALGGAFVGYLVGREYDQLHSLRYRGGTPLNPGATSVSLEGEPGVLAISDSMLAVGGTAGVQLFSTTAGLRASMRRAAGVRGISALAFNRGSGALAVGAGTGLYVYPPRTGPGVLVREGEAVAAEGGEGMVYLAVGSRVEAVPAAADSARGWPGVDLGKRVSALAHDQARGVIWATADSLLVALRPSGDSFTVVSRMPLDATPTRVSVSGNKLALALGERGVRLYDVSDVESPREAWKWNGARFAYDVSLTPDRLFVAAGVEGVYLLGSGTDTPTVLGLARELGFATALVSRGGYTYMLDRTENALRRFKTDF